MRYRGIVETALAVCAGVILAGCVSGSSGDYGLTQVSPAVAPRTEWQWNETDTGGEASATLQTSIVALVGTSEPHTASLSLTCRDARPSLAVTWDVPVNAGASPVSYRFDGQPARDVNAQSVDAQTLVVSDQLVVSRFLDEAAASQLLMVRANAAAAGPVEATFTTSDEAGILTRFRTECPTGTN